MRVTAALADGVTEAALDALIVMFSVAVSTRRNETLSVNDGDAERDISSVR